jgi:acetyl esterase
MQPGSLFPRRGLIASADLLAAAQPTEADVRYGPHERNVLDFYKAPAAGPAPVLIFFHGGGFKAGDKRSFGDKADRYLRAGISVVSSNYRFSQHAIYPGPMLDGARVVQFVRSKAREWNIDPRKVVLSGSSAGATISLWIALHDDLADPAGADAIARISTRVSCVTVTNGPTFMDPERIRKEFGVTDFGGMLQFFGVGTLEEFSAPPVRRLALDSSPIEHAGKGDPPLFLDYTGALTPMPLPADTMFGDWIHHPHSGELLKQKYDQLGLECLFYHRGKPAPEGAEIAFLNKHLASR